MHVIDYATTYKELFIKSGVIKSERMTIAPFKSGQRYEIEKEMSHIYLEDLEDSVQTTIQF